MRVNHGPCRMCGNPILYLGCHYCSPSCNFLHLKVLDRREELLDRQRSRLLRVLLERSRTAGEGPRRRGAVYL